VEFCVNDAAQQIGASIEFLRAMPDKPGHPAAISAEHCFEPHIGGAALARETKTPAVSATIANMTPALLPVLVIVEPLCPGPFPC
jgi:hypothetical protein